MKESRSSSTLCFKQETTLYQNAQLPLKLAEAVAKLMIGKVAGPDGIFTEFVKKSVKLVLGQLLEESGTPVALKPIGPVQFSC